jgi:hypothetical protein
MDEENYLKNYLLEGFSGIKIPRYSYSRGGKCLLVCITTSASKVASPRLSSTEASGPEA